MYDDIGSNLWNEGLTERASSAGPQSGAIANEGQEAEGLQLESDAHTEGGQVGKARGRAAERTEGLRQKAADYRFARSPAGRARAAAERGDRIFQYRSMLTNAGHGSDLSAIEAEGWNLDQTDFQQETETTAEPDGEQYTQSVTYAVYLFRR